MNSTNRWSAMFLCPALILFVCVSTPAADATEPSSWKVISYNVWYGFTKDSQRRAAYQEWMAEQQPDVVALQELNGYTPERLAADARSWGHGHQVLLKPEGFPIGITSRWEIKHVRRVLDGMHHGLLVCQIGDIYYYVVHLHPSDFAHREREVQIVLDDLRRHVPENADVCLIGDFNALSPRDAGYYRDTPALVTFFDKRDAELGENNLQDHHLHFGVMQAFEDRGFIDVIAQQRPANQRPFGTFPTSLRADEDHGSERRLDYILCTPSLARRCVSAGPIQDPATAMLSDHYPVYAEFELPRSSSQGNRDSRDSDE